MASIKDAHDFINMILDKSQSGFFPPEEIDEAIHRASLSAFSRFYQEFIETNFIHAALNPFRKVKIYTSADFSAGGNLNLPAGTEYVTGLYITYVDNAVGAVNRKVTVYKSDEIADALSSQVRKPVETWPAAVHVQGDDGAPKLTFYPSVNTYAGALHYLKIPAKPFYPYTVSGNNYIYNAGGSPVHPEWQDTYINGILLKACEYLGVNLNSPDVVQYTMSKKVSDNG